MTGRAKTEVALQFSESCAAEVALHHSLFCSADVTLPKPVLPHMKLHCNIEEEALQESGAFLQRLPACFRLLIFTGGPVR